MYSMNMYTCWGSVAQMNKLTNIYEKLKSNI